MSISPPGRPLRLDIDAEDVGRGLGRLVVALLEIVRQLLERQALRRMDARSLSAEEIERLGRALLDLEERLAQLRDTFGCSAADLTFTGTDLGITGTFPPPARTAPDAAAAPSGLRQPFPPDGDQSWQQHREGPPLATNER